MHKIINIEFNDVLSVKHAIISKKMLRMTYYAVKKWTFIIQIAGGTTLSSAKATKQKAAVEEALVLTPELKSFIAEWKDQPGNLIMVLHRVQEHFGYVPREIAFEVAALLEAPVAKIYGVITFYHFFKMTKPGRHTIAVCMGTACYLKGGQDLVRELETLLGCACGEVTDDKEFSITAVRCIGCCGLAPVLTVDGEVYGNLNPDDLAGIVAKYRGH
jgi:NADH-quinone oxidoreductase subunit E